MGTWGVRLNQNDVYADLKDIYTALLRYGKSDEEALEITVKYFSGLTNGENEDSIIFRLSLADILHRLGRLTDEIRNNALRTIADGADLNKWYKYSQVKGDARKAVLDELKEMLTSEQPKAKKFRKSVIKYVHGKTGIYSGINSTAILPESMGCRASIFSYRRPMTTSHPTLICEY